MFDLTLKRLGGLCRGNGNCLLLRPLQIGLGVRQVSRTGGVATLDRAFLEVTLQDITTRERVLAQNTHVGAVTGVCMNIKERVG